MSRPPGAPPKPSRGAEQSAKKRGMSTNAHADRHGGSASWCLLSGPRSAPLRRPPPGARVLGHRLPPTHPHSPSPPPAGVQTHARAVAPHLGEVDAGAGPATHREGVKNLHGVRGARLAVQARGIARQKPLTVGAARARMDARRARSAATSGGAKLARALCRPLQEAAIGRVGRAGATRGPAARLASGDPARAPRRRGRRFERQAASGAGGPGGKRTGGGRGRRKTARGDRRRKSVPAIGAQTLPPTAKGRTTRRASQPQASRFLTRNLPTASLGSAPDTKGHIA